MTKILEKILVILIFVCVILACSPNYELKNIQTGIANFQIPNDRNQSRFPYTYFSTFQTIPQVAFAINNIQSRNIQYQDFYIIPTNQTISHIDFSLTHKQGWSLFTINFILSSRNDLVLESFAINLNQQVSNSLIVQIQPNYKFLQFTSKVFLNGFEMNPLFRKDNQTLSLDISVRLVSFSKQNLQMDFTGSSFKQIKKIYLSYVMVSIGNKAYISDQGSISIDNLIGVQSRNLQRSFIQSQYKLYGINKLNFQGNTFALISNIKSDLTSTIYSMTLINQLVIDYFVLSNHPKNICNCQDNTLRYSFNNSCLFYCPQNTFSYSHPQGGFVCLLKPVQIVNPMTNKILNYGPVNVFPQSIDNQSLTTQQIIKTTKNSSSLIVGQNQCKVKNSYFDGKSCSCLTGFKNVSNQCLSNNLSQQQINFVNSSTILILSCSGFNQVNINGTCVCVNGYQRVNNQCQLKTNKICGPNSFLYDNSCICMLGYIKTLNNTCQLKNNTQIICKENQINNGLGICICQQGYFNVSGQCVKDKPCPLNAEKTENGNCICKPNFFNISGECSFCPAGQYWLSTESKCVQFCGQNSIKNNLTGKCQCIPTYGISKSNTCQYCPPDKFILNNYCVTCQLNQYYNRTSGQCQCKEQYHMQINGLCIPKCPNNQYFDPVNKVCRCLLSLGRLNGVCQMCPKNYFVKEQNEQCLPCGEGSIYQNGKCICKSQFAVDMFGNCAPCGSIPNTFMFKGRCSTCAGEKIYNGTTCICPVGTIFRNLKCLKVCKDDQLMDNNGNCYKCPVNEIIVNNQCICRKSFQRVNDTCLLVCPPGSFIFKDKCSVCPDSKVFDPQINGCVCPNGLYLNVYNQCQRLSISLIQCPVGQYLNMEKGCTNCVSSCEKCENSFTCIKCQSPYFLVNGKCKDICGNGVLQSGQQCDDKNLKDEDGCSSTCKIQKSFKCSGTPSICVFTVPQIKCGNGIIQTNEQCDDNNIVSNDGCSSLCKTQRMFSCYGQPSTCKYNATYHVCGNGFVQYSQKCDDGNFNNGDGCSLNCTTQTGFLCTSQPSVCISNIASGMTTYGKISYNLNNIYISLLTDQRYQFNSNSQMETFIKVSVLNMTYIPSTYCTQRQYPDLDIFDCLLLYSSGIPNKAFKVQFSYTSPANNKVFELQIDVDPLAVQTQRIKNLRRL